MGACSVWATRGLPMLMACVLSWSTLLRLQVALLGNCLKWALGCMLFPGLSCSGSGSWVLHKGTEFVGPAFCALPRSEQLKWPGAWQVHSPSWVVSLIISSVPVLRFPGCTARQPSQVSHVSPLESWSLTVTLLADVNHPGSQEDFVSNWKPSHSLVEDAVSGAKIAPCLPALAVARLPLCLWWGKGPVCSWLALLRYLFNPLFCEQARLCLRAFCGNVLSLSFFLSSYPTVWVAISR